MNQKKINFKIGALAAFGLLLAWTEASAQAPVVRQLEPAWEKALGGNAVCEPVAFRGRVYVLSADRSITCLDEAGEFLWRKALKNRPAPRLAVTESGVVCVFGRSGEMTAYSANGELLWTYRGKTASLPVLNPYEGRDGRLFILYEDEMVCLAANGLQKWRSRVNGRGAQMISEDGLGNAIIIKAGGDITPISPYGIVYPDIKTGREISRVVPLLRGTCALFVAESASSCKIAAVDLNSSKREASDPLNILWERGGMPQPVAAMRYRDAIYCVSADGRLFAINSEDGDIILQSEFYAQGSTAGAAMFHDSDADSGRFILLAQSFCAAFSEDGEILWHAAFSKPLASPVFTENGYAVSAPQNSVVTAYRAEASPGRKGRLEARSSHKQTYGIFAGAPRGYIRPETVTLSYFEETRKKIEEGRLGQDEAEISRQLAGILNNDSGMPFFSVRFDSYQRSLAAQLLGAMGSEEARAILIGAARAESDPTVIAGILRGLAALGPENGRETLDAVLRISRLRGMQDEFSAPLCDALFSVARGSYGELAAEAAAAIYAYTGGQYSTATRKYALQIVEKIIE